MAKYSICDVHLIEASHCIFFCLDLGTFHYNTIVLPKSWCLDLEIAMRLVQILFIAGILGSSSFRRVEDQQAFPSPHGQHQMHTCTRPINQ